MGQGCAGGEAKSSFAQRAAQEAVSGRLPPTTQDLYNHAPAAAVPRGLDALADLTLALTRTFTRR